MSQNLKTRKKKSAVPAPKAEAAPVAQTEHTENPPSAPATKKARPKKGAAKPVTLGRTLFRMRWLLVRLVLALVILGAAASLVYPKAEAFIEEEYSSRAVSKGRVLLRGCQIVATQKLTDFMSWEDTEQYLCSSKNLPEIVTEAKFEVQPVAIEQVQLNKQGLIDRFECVLEYENRRYRIRYDLPNDIAEPELLEKLEKPKDNS